MERVYYNEFGALIVNEVNRSYRFVKNTKGLDYAKSNSLTAIYRNALNQREEFLIEIGFVKEQENGGIRMNELVGKVEQWAKNKGLDKAESSKQMLKVVEEVGEVAAALARDDKDALRDGIGDVVVTLVILAMQNDMDLYECLNCAYDEIKGRTGKMVNGVFVKSNDLK